MRQGNYAEALRTFQRAYWTALLTFTGGDVTEAAKRAGVDRAHLYNLFRDIGIVPASFRGATYQAGAADYTPPGGRLP